MASPDPMPSMIMRASVLVKVEMTEVPEICQSPPAMIASPAVIVTEVSEVLSGQVRPAVIPARDPGHACELAVTVRNAERDIGNRERPAELSMLALIASIPVTWRCGAANTASGRQHPASNARRSESSAVFHPAANAT